jgi:hypothetical protein
MHRGGRGDAQGGRGGCTCILCIPPGYAPGEEIAGGEDWNVEAEADEIAENTCESGLESNDEIEWWSGTQPRKTKQRWHCQYNILQKSYYRCVCINTRLVLLFTLQSTDI